jgi:DNA modification methylase
MQIKLTAIDTIKPHPNNARVHSRKQVNQIAGAIKAFGFLVPVLIDESGTMLAGHGRHAAAKLLGMTEIPTVKVEGLSPAKKRAFMIADNRLAEHAAWDRKQLAVELPELAEILVTEALDISITGFAVAEVDQIVVDFEEREDPDDEIPDQPSSPDPASKPGDLWQLGPHRLLCGDARDPEALRRLMGDELAGAAFLDPPFNVRVKDIVGRGSVKHAEFAMASGEMTREGFTEFLKTSLGAAASVSRDGAVHYVCMDWRHVGELVDAGRATYGEFLNLVIWAKTNSGQGSFYRSQHELIGVFRVGETQHLNNVQLGRFGRNRSNIWRYPGVNTFRAGRMADLSSHPTVKPIALVADAIKDSTKRNDIVLDTFCGSGTTVMAAEKVGRRGYGVEYEPHFVDVAIRRWQTYTGKDAIHVATGACFDEAAAQSTINTNKLAA